jgi:hypothetical protein
MVSCEGMPFFNSKNEPSKSFFALPKLAIAVNPSAPQITAQIVIMMISCNG